MPRTPAAQLSEHPEAAQAARAGLQPGREPVRSLEGDAGARGNRPGTHRGGAHLVLL